MEEFLKALGEEVTTAAFSRYIDRRREKRDQQKRIEKAQDIYLDILKVERDNTYYNDLTKVLSESRVKQDCFAIYEKNQPSFELAERLNPVFEQLSIPIENRSKITGVIQKIRASLRAIMLEPNPGAEARLAIRMEEKNADSERSTDALPKNAEKHDSEALLSFTDIEAYSEQARDTANLIPRKWVSDEHPNEALGTQALTALLQRDKRIILVNHAGFGKTMALNQLYADSKATGKYAVLLSLNRYPGIPLFHEMLNKNISAPEQIVMILDGYDEVKTEFRSQLDDTVNQIAERYPQMAIVISSRENFFEAQRFERFSRYRLAGLTEQDRRQYVQRQGIAVEPFWKQLWDKNLMEISENAFYFVELIRLWQQYNELPDEAKIMERIVEGRIQEDRGKLMLAVPELEQKEAELRQAFGCIAMVMQCTRRYTLTAEEVKRLRLKIPYSQLNLHGIWEMKDAGQLQFSHNNFREYFAACWLSLRPLKDILWCITDRTTKNKIKPSWRNVLAYLAKLRTARDLQEWIAEHTPEVIFLFEKERFSKKERFSLFKQMYDVLEEKQIWAPLDYQSSSRMGAFISGTEAIEYILEKLSKNINNRQKQNLLRIMRFIDSLDAEQNKCRDVVSNIAFDVEVPECVRNDALDVMQAFSHVFSEYVPTAAKMCMESTAEDYRYHLYRFIDAAGQLEQNFCVVLHELEQPENEEGAVNAGRCIYLERKIATLQSPQAVADLMAFFIEHPDQIRERSIRIEWSHLFDVAIAHDGEMQSCFLPLVEQLYFKASKRIAHDVIAEIKRYMIATHTEKAFLDFIQEHDPISDFVAVEELMCPSLGAILVSYYEEDKLNDMGLLTKVVTRYSGDDDTCRILQRAILLKTGQNVVPRHRRNAEALRMQGKQRCFDALFSRTDFLQLVKELGRTVGMDTQIKKAIHIRQEGEQEVALQDCAWILFRVFNTDSTISEAIDRITNWEWERFQYSAVSEKIGENSGIELSRSQRQWMEEYTRKELEKIDLQKAAKKLLEEEKYEVWTYTVLTTMVKLDMNCTETFFKSLLLIPASLLGESNRCAFPPYLLKHIPQEDMKKQVLSNIHQEELRDCVAAAHLQYCAEHKLTGAKSFAIQFLNREDGKDYRYCTLQYISSVYGAETIVGEVVPLCDDDDFLKEIVRHIPREMKASELDEKLDAAYARNPSRKWMEILIQRNHRNALERYLAEVEEINGIPETVRGCEIPSLTDSIEYVLDVAQLDIVLKLLYLVTVPGFADKKYFGLRDSCWKSVRRMANAQYEDVRKVIEQEKEIASGEYKLLCIDLIDRIDEEHQAQDDRGMSFDQAVIFASK